jgi:hypothetical protein
MSGHYKVALIALVLSTALAPPGLCACWLNPQVKTYHPHLFRQAGKPHSHDYLFQMSMGNTGNAAPAATQPADVLIMLLGSSSLLLLRPGHTILPDDWRISPPVPPPRSFS